MFMKDIIVKRTRRRIDYRRIIRVLGLEGEFIDYFYNTHSRLISVRRQARYFLQYKKVDIWTADVFLSDHPEILCYDTLISTLKGDIKQLYLEA